jgi:uncharacterized membrane protein
MGFPHQVASAKLFIIIGISHSTSQDPKKLGFHGDSPGMGKPGRGPVETRSRVKMKGFHAGLDSILATTPGRFPLSIQNITRRSERGFFTMGFLNRATSNGIEGLTAAISFGGSYYVGLVLLSIILIVLLVHAYRVWEEIHDVEEPDSPSDLLDSFEQAHAEGELDAQELDRVRKLLLDGNGTGGERTVVPHSPTPTTGTIKDPLSSGGAQPMDPAKDDARTRTS